MNGRGESCKNDFTFVGPHGASVLDNCLVPYESMDKFGRFEVLKVSEVVDRVSLFDQLGKYVLPDHSFLRWNLLLTNVNNSIDINKNSHEYIFVERVKFSTKHVVGTFMSDNEVQIRIFHIIDKLESSFLTQSSINEVYDNFVNIVHSEMYSKLPHKVMTL